MNPELMRNLWLEASPRRLFIMAGVIGFIFATISVNGVDVLKSTAAAGEAIFYVIVILWGTNSAAYAVVGEIRDRTWDLQRLSAIAPWDMMWGKLFGATSYVWFGGLIALIPVALHAFDEKGAVSAIVQVCYYLSIGLIAHGVSLLASLVAVRRRMSQSRLNTFGFQVLGIIAALIAATIWATATPDILGFNSWLQEGISKVTWYGWDFDPPAFYLGSLAIFFGWVLAGTHQFMRQELQVSMNPWVWIGFLAFIATYAAGFTELQTRETGSPLSMTLGEAESAARFVIAFLVVLFATYVSLAVMPKDRVKLRWIVTQTFSGRLVSAFSSLPGWAYGLTATILAGTFVVAQLDAADLSASVGKDGVRLFVAGVIGELVRNIGVFIFFNALPGQRRGDFASVLTLVLLYYAAPLFLSGAGIGGALALISPWLAKSSLATAAAAMWIEAAIVWAFAAHRVMSSSAERTSGA